jgi:hypothetical protein
VRFLVFATDDPANGHGVDALIRLELARLKEPKRARYPKPQADRCQV